MGVERERSDYGFRKRDQIMDLKRDKREIKLWIERERPNYG